MKGWLLWTVLRLVLVYGWLLLCAAGCFTVEEQACVETCDDWHLLCGEPGAGEEEPPEHDYCVWQCTEAPEPDDCTDCYDCLNAHEFDPGVMGACPGYVLPEEHECVSECRHC